jgi:hypothetical protein
MDLLELRSVQSESFVRHPWEFARARIVLHFINKRNKIPKEIVDIGSGDAFIAGSVAKEYPRTNVTAIDINYKKDDLKVLTINKPENLTYFSDIHSIEKSPCKIDIILLMDILEHIENPGTFIKTIKNLYQVSHKTDFFITVPAFQQLFSNHDKELGHFKRYSRRELISLLTSNGFRIKESGYFFNNLLLFRGVQKLFNCNPKSHNLYNWKAGKLFTSLITTLFWMEFKISWYLSQIRIYLPGLTCYCICYPLPS